VHNFYTGYLQIGWIQLGLTLGSTVLTVLTLGLFGFVATIVIPGVAVWGLVEGILFSSPSGRATTPWTRLGGRCATDGHCG